MKDNYKPSTLKSPKRPVKKRNGGPSVSLIIVGSIAIITLLVKMLPESEVKRTYIDKHDAKIVAEDEVKSRLKSPSTAEFSDWGRTEVTPIENGYKVEGYVDAQNSFGAMIRHNYSVEVWLNNETGKIMYSDLVIE
jgi:hypothetical protein